MWNRLWILNPDGFLKTKLEFFIQEVALKKIMKNLASEDHCSSFKGFFWVYPPDIWRVISLFS